MSKVEHDQMETHNSSQFLLSFLLLPAVWTSVVPGSQCSDLVSVVYIHRTVP